MPRQKKPMDLFRNIKPVKGERGKRPPPRRKSAPLSAKPAEDRIVAERSDLVTIALTIERELFEKYNAGKSRGQFSQAMREQLWKRFE